MKKILVTGAAGFIGFHLCKRLFSEPGLDTEIVGLDNLNDYYDVELKKTRLRQLEERKNFRFARLSLEDPAGMADFFAKEKFTHVVNLAAQAGVRHSLTHPHVYINSNVTGFINVLEGCRHTGVKHLVYASSSSVYGANTDMPFSPHRGVNHPLSLYAATKRSNELMAHTYSHLFNLPTTGFRFFTVYGPWGRPDMALFIFTRNILEGKPIDVFNEGKMKRDFTYVDDIVEGLFRAIGRHAEPDPRWSSKNPDPATSSAPFRIYNLGNHSPVELSRYIEAVEKALGKKAIKNLLPLQPGDVPETNADIEDTARDFGFRPSTAVEDGVNKFVKWYREYYRV